MIKVEDEVRTKIKKCCVPIGSFGIVESIDDTGIWVDIYIPDDADVPVDTVRYTEEQLEIQ